MTAAIGRRGRLARIGRPKRFHGAAAGLRELGSGIAAIGAKELRGRMRGRRAFAVITIHLLFLAGMAFMIQELQIRNVSMGFSSTTTADIGRGLFVGLLAMLTLVVLILSPGSTAGAISLEREKQTLDLLTVTPISSLAIVLGKLLASVGWILLLLLASVPVMALVFTYGGVGPEDIVRGYVVLTATAFCYGALGLFTSALLKRTQAATIINLVLAIAFTGGTAFLYALGAQATYADAQQKASDTNQPVNIADIHLPPSAMLWINPAAAQADVLCGADTTISTTCGLVLVITDRTDIVQAMATGISSGAAFTMPRDSYWPRGVATMLVAGLLLVLASSQLISPTRRWRRPRPLLRLPFRNRKAPGAVSVAAPGEEAKTADETGAPADIGDALEETSP